MASSSVLIISCFFPPVGGAGVQRVTKFVKYLPEFGWQPVVLTVSNPSVPVFDESLMKDIPESVAVYRARTLEPDYRAKQAVSAASDTTSGGRSSLKTRLRHALRGLANAVLQPDPQVLWLPGAWRKACEIIRTEQPQVILTSAPPFSSLVLGAMLARKFKLPLILDYRDEWDISNSVWENKGAGRWSTALQTRMQNYAIRAASALVATTQMSAGALQEKSTALGTGALVRCIYNGYDSADFLDVTHSDEPSEQFLIAYVGTLWNLTSIEPLVVAIKQLAKTRPELAASMELALAGRRTAEQERVLSSLSDSGVMVTKQDYLDHEAAVGLMQRANVLVLLLSDLNMAQRVVPGKLFEYFATGKTILAIAPRGEVWRLLEDHPDCLCAEPSDIDAIVEFLAAEMRKKQQGAARPQSSFDARRYERRELTRQLAALMEEIR